MQTVIYCRVSSQQQLSLGFSIENQQDRALAYCLYKGFQNPQIIIDGAKSGKRMKNRDGIQEIIKLVETKQVDNIIVYSLSRIGRNAIETLTFIELLKKHKVILHSITESADGSTPYGRYIIGIIALNAQLESEIIGERTQSILKNKKSKDQVYCKALTGFDNIEGKLIPNVEMENVKTIFSLTKTCGPHKIASFLNQNNKTTKNGNRFFPSSIKKIINNRQLYEPYL